MPEHCFTVTFGACRVRNASNPQRLGSAIPRVRDRTARLRYRMQHGSSAQARHRRPTSPVRCRGDRRRTGEARGILCRQRARAAHRGGAAPQGGARREPRRGRAAAAQGPPRRTLRRTVVPVAGRDHPRALRFRGPAPLPLEKPVGSRAHGDRRHRRVRARADGAGLRHRSPVRAALQADRLGRVDRRGDPLLPVGHGAEGRPRHALDRRVHPPGQGRHDDPHRDPRGALPARRSRPL